MRQCIVCRVVIVYQPAQVMKATRCCACLEASSYLSSFLMQTLAGKCKIVLLSPSLFVTDGISKGDNAIASVCLSILPCILLCLSILIT